MKTVLKAERKATRGPKPRDFWGKLQRKFTSAVDDFFATLQDRAADVRFYDCDLFMVCKVTPPGADPVWLVGAFYNWHNANAVAVYVNRWLADFASAHAAATRRRGAAQQMLIRVPPGARAGQRFRANTPRGDSIEFVVPNGASAGDVIVVAY